MNDNNHKNNQDPIKQNAAQSQKHDEDATFEPLEQDGESSEPASSNASKIKKHHAISTHVINTTKQKISAARDRFKAWRESWNERWSLLHPNQIIYLIALAIYIFADGSMEEGDFDLWLVGLLAFFGMARELWAIFIKVWESTLGRLVLIVLYAALANYTLAMAAQKVNAVIGADPTYLYHTQGLVTFLILPLWIMSVSVAAMALTFGFLQIFRLFGGILVFLRLRRKRNNAKEVFPKTFIIIRLVLLVPVVLTLSYSLKWYSEELNLSDTPGLNISWDGDTDTRNKIKDLSLTIIDERLSRTDIDEQEREELLTARADLIAAVEAKEKKIAAPAQNTADDLGAEPAQDEELAEAKFLDKLIASFVYNYETFQHSHCVKAENERVVYISEEQILAVSKDDSLSTGYLFTTRDCIPKTASVP